MHTSVRQRNTTASSQSSHQYQTPTIITTTATTKHEPSVVHHAHQLPLESRQQRHARLQPPRSHCLHLSATSQLCHPQIPLKLNFAVVVAFHVLDILNIFAKSMLVSAEVEPLSVVFAKRRL